MTAAALQRATGYHITVTPWRPSPRHRTRYRTYATEGEAASAQVVGSAEGLTSSAAISALERAILDAHRLRVLARDNWQCVVCGSRHALQMHHVIHRSQGRDHRLSNLASCCWQCHDREHRGDGRVIEAIRDYMTALGGRTK